MDLTRTLRTLITGATLLGLLAGCGRSATFSYHSHYTVRTEPVPRSFQHGLPDPIWFPENSRQLNPAPTTRYRPSLVGVRVPHGNPTRAILKTVNALAHANTLVQAEDQVVSADRSWVHQEWDRGIWRPSAPQYPAVHLWEIKSMPASAAPFSWVVRDRFGTRVWRDSWVIAGGMPGTTYAHSLQLYGPRSISWDYFLNVDGHWLLYQICN
ncbi:hypothetical protein BXT84_00435 [Sulfobacillus thermotolerans]|uniref:Lipoprotein n=1 Tax=Sulfobacillus thermotolerans TaxID=338644 RepID=A0ABM6RMP4_9FIRM|nr:hypothetical protein BXT84_00435 [Sulfobacillus thermotolerans]